MIDDFLVITSVQIILLCGIDILDLHGFGLETVLTIIMHSIMYYIYHRKHGQ